MSTAKKVTFSEKMKELDSLLEWFESSDVTVEEALVKYEKAIKLAKELEAQLKTAKNKVEVIKQSTVS